mmetsp:Transcript_46155/g.90984  ORF Transcript_46155/g.90984 Transcript_46155/m.90984 type:complete len:84 (+) Transcript_46155:2327-2578(+)
MELRVLCTHHTASMSLNLERGGQQQHTGEEGRQEKETMDSILALRLAVLVVHFGCAWTVTKDRLLSVRHASFVGPACMDRRGN